MKALLIILAVLFATLFIAIPLVERFSPNNSSEQTQRMSRWVMPLLLIMMVVQATLYFWS